MTALSHVAKKVGIFLLVFTGVAAFGYLGSTSRWFGLAATRFEPGVQYEFVHTDEARANIAGQELPTRQFQIDQTTIVTVLAEGPRGETAVIEDQTLPPNTFVFEMKVAPAVVLGGQMFQMGYTYVETRYHIGQGTEDSIPLVPDRQP